MAIKQPQYDLPPGVDAGSSVWDDGSVAGALLNADYFAAPQAAVHARVDWLAFDTAATTGPQAVTQGTRFDNVNTFYAGTVSQTGAAQSITQGARFNNANQFYAGTVTTVAGVVQAARFDNANQFFAGTVTQTTPALPIVQTVRFDNINAFYPGTVTQTGGITPVVQDARFDNQNQFFGGVVSGGAQPEPLAGGHYGAWWADKYRKMFERKPEQPTIAEVLEYVNDEPAEAVEIVREVAPQAIPIGLVWQDVQANAQLHRLIADQIIIAAKMRQLAIERDADEDDIETMLLLG